MIKLCIPIGSAKIHIRNGDGIACGHGSARGSAEWVGNVMPSLLCKRCARQLLGAASGPLRLAAARALRS